MKATEIIRDEHRSFAAVLQGLRYLMAEVHAGRMQANFALFDAMMRYIERFPEQLHHPKEDEHLFPVIRRHAPAVGPVLDELECQHEVGRGLIKELRNTFERWRAGTTEHGAFAEGVEKYAEFHWKHMRMEEDEILVVADRGLPPAEAQAIDGVFMANQDPISGVRADREFRDLFTRIVNLAPAPMGVGPAAEQPTT